MKKNVNLFTRILAAALIAAFALCLLPACANGGNSKTKDEEEETVKDPEKAIVGTWNGTLDVTDKLNEQLSGKGTVTGTFKDLGCDYTLTFYEDGKYKLSVPDESADKYINDIIDQMLPMLMDYFRENIANELGVSAAQITDQQIFDYLVEHGRNIRSTNDLKEMILDQLDTSSLKAKLPSDFENEYRFEGGKLYIKGLIGRSDETEVGYDFKGSAKLTLTLPDGVELPANFSFTFPLKLTKAK